MDEHNDEHKDLENITKYQIQVRELKNAIIKLKKIQ